MKAYGMRANRWSDNDRYWGPFTYAKAERADGCAVILQSEVHEDNDDKATSLRITLGRHTLIWVLPWQIVKPHLTRHYPKSWSAEDVKRIGRDYYDTAEPRKYGFSLHDAGTVGGATHLIVYRGRSTHDSSTDTSCGCFLPWTSWRHVRHSFYGLQGEHLFDEPQSSGRLGSDDWRARRDREEAVPTRKFLIRDHDGAEIVVTTKIEEREWRKGTGWFTWLSWFKRPIIHRSLDLAFEHEVGPEKGSWKGGLMGTGFAMLPGELHEAALRRYCAEEHRAKGSRYRIEFVGVVS